MKLKDLVRRAHRLAEPYCVNEGSRFQLKGVDPRDTQNLKSEDKPKAKKALQEGVEAMAELQELLYAQDRWAVLLIFQAMDAAGKDSAIKHVMSGVNPQGCQVHSFKAPSREELDHDFLWRCARKLPERGRIGIFNRSYYEEVLVVRVHPEWLDQQRLPIPLRTPHLWRDRYEDIRNWEKYLARNGVVIRKFFLHVSSEEQKRRFLERIDNPAKHWKFAESDVRERQFWPDYMAAYEEMIRQTATAYAPWYVVPADNKWFTRVVVAAAVIDTLQQLDMKYPTVTAAHRAALAAAKVSLRNSPPIPSKNR